MKNKLVIVKEQGMEKTFKNSLQVFEVRGGNKGKTEQVLAKTEADAIEVSDIIEMGRTTATAIDTTPTLRQMVSGANEPMDDIEWYDMTLEEWVCVTIDSDLFMNAEIDILSDDSYI
ncbi:MAG: Unknown protein [uncultured Sulfurovum sp.]|uniref:Uncharacterized protein n=1 Tax=uncultured Sulfurovum sp. TaxID=269237 RepID=A0A6S6SV21_9BACT|nr:MAG: Unknown protein [uncultured Sulfurovum sp.]